MLPSDSWIDGLTILGLIVALVFLAGFCFIILGVLARTVRDTIKWGWTFRLPLIFLGNLIDQTKAAWNGQEVVSSPGRKEDL